MKIAIVFFAGLSIATLIAISAFQLAKFCIQELADLVSEAWDSPNLH